jgi:hypothetical protein
MIKAVLFSLLTLPLLAGATTLYRCSDEFGHTTYTNYKTGKAKCTVLSRDDVPSSMGPSTGNSAKAATPANFPKVADATQKSRDGDRRYILDQEVQAETKHLQEAQKNLAEQLVARPAGAGNDGVQPIRDRIALHERNLDALRREISNLK